MTEYVLSFKPAIGLYGRHDPSAALFVDGALSFAVEEERLSRDKHAVGQFPARSIEACLDHAEIDLGDVSKVVLPYDPALRARIIDHYLAATFRMDGLARKLTHLEGTSKSLLRSRLWPNRRVKRELDRLGDTVPPIERKPHHRCHAASAFHPSPFDEALVLTLDAKGEYDSTAIWYGDGDGIQRLETFEHPNSLGLFFAVITEYLGYRMFNGEGKVMGLAPYGSPDPAIESKLRSLIDTGADYDVTELTRRWHTAAGVERLETLFDRPRNDTPGEFDQWHADLASVAQSLLEETVTALVERFCEEHGVSNVCFAGGVALNCKMNRTVLTSPSVDELFVQPVANDAGLALGAGWLDRPPRAVEPMRHVYFGPQTSRAEIRSLLTETKVAYTEPDDLERTVAERLANGALVGWFQGRSEMGPRALGNRSILADPRSISSRDRVNRFVKHREEWRPFAPSMLAEAADEYLVDPTPSRYMIQTADVQQPKRTEIPAVIHPADATTRPQLVYRETNPRYHGLISAFEDVTGVPVVLNTSFNDSGEPIVNTPIEAIRAFFGMGLDVLVLEGFLLEKTSQTHKSASEASEPAHSASTLIR